MSRLVSIGGPLLIPRVFRSYQRTERRDATTHTALAPTLDERGGALDPAAGVPFENSAAVEQPCRSWLPPAL